MADGMIYYNEELKAVPTHLICPKCLAPTNTNVQVQNTLKTHLLAALCCLFGCCLCAWVPYTVNDLRSVSHFCQKCNRYIGNYRPNYSFF